MSMSPSQHESYGVNMKVEKKKINIKKIAKKTISEFKDNTSRLFLITGILFTGFGEIISDMSWKWYMFMFAIMIFYVVDYFQLKIKPIKDLFKE